MSESVAVMPSETSKQAVRELLPELPSYMEKSLSNLSDDKDLRGIEFTKEMKATVCRVYQQSGSVVKAAERIGVSHMTVYRHLEADAEFRAAFSLSKFSIGDRIQAFSVRRAMEPNGTIDRMCQLKRFFPSVYRESSPQIAVGVSVNFDLEPPASSIHAA